MSGGEDSGIPARPARPSPPAWTGVLAAVLLPVAAAFALYGDALSRWWTWDDIPLLRYALAYAPRQYLLDPEVFRQLPWRVLAPLQVLSFDADVTLFGLRPAPFYAHHLLALGLCGAALALLLRFWLPSGFALAGGGLFLLGAPVCAVAQELMDRHYLEGLLLAAAATGCFVRGLRRERPGLSALATLFYAGAAAAKEVYVPLPLLLLALPEGEPRRRLRRLLPMALALAAYLGWRYWMLGTLVGGYGYAVDAAELPGMAARLPAQIAAGLLPLRTLPGLLLAGIGIACLAALCASGRRAAVTTAVAAAALLALLPILPVSKVMWTRYLLVPWLLVALVLPLGAYRMSRLSWLPALGGRWRRAGALLLAAGCVLALAVNRLEWDRVAARYRRLSAEGRFVAEAGERDLLRHPLSEPYVLLAAAALREEHGPSGKGPGWFYDDLYLCTMPVGGRRVWGWSAAGERLEDLTPGLPRLRRRHCRGIRWRAPLEVRLAYSDHEIAWQLGPYREGEYSLLLGDGAEKHEVPPREHLRLGARPGVSLRVAYRAPEGWATYSPVLTMDFATRPVLHWRRR